MTPDPVVGLGAVRRDIPPDTRHGLRTVRTISQTPLQEMPGKFKAARERPFGIHPHLRLSAGYSLALRRMTFHSAIGTIAAHTLTSAITFRYWRINGILPKK